MLFSQMLVKCFRCQNIHLWSCQHKKKVSGRFHFYLMMLTSLKRSWLPLTNDLRLLHRVYLFLICEHTMSTIYHLRKRLTHCGTDNTTSLHERKRVRSRCVPEPCFRVCSSNLASDGEENSSDTFWHHCIHGRRHIVPLISKSTGNQSSSSSMKLFSSVVVAPASRGVSRNLIIASGER